MIRSRVLALVAGAAIGVTACGSSSSTGGAVGCTNLNSVGLATGAGSATAAAAPALASAADLVSLPNAADTVLKIGFQGMLAGDLKNYGIDAKNGVQLAVDDANAAGGITVGGKHYTLAVDAQDDNGATAAGGQAAAQKLVDDKVVAVVGGIFSTASIAAQKIYHDNGLAQISPSATNPKYTDAAATPVTSFRTIGRDDQQGPIGADFLVKTLGCKNIAVADDKSTYGAGLADAAAAEITKAGGKVVDTEHVTAGAGGDFNAQLTTIKGKTPDAIYYGGYSREAGPLAKQAKALGLNVPIVGGDGWQDTDYTSLAGTAANGNFATNGGPPTTAMNGFDAFNAKYKAKFNQDIFQYAPQSYDAANIIINAIKKVGPDKAAIAAEVAKTKDYAGISGTVSFNSKGDLTVGVFTIWKVVGGTWKSVKSASINNPVS
jgi:branched-chain amino acid transport system substrate-binding protein